MCFFITFSQLNHGHTFLILYQIVIGNFKQKKFRQHSSFFVKHDYFNNDFFPPVITEWNKLDCYISNVDSFEVLKKRVLNFVGPVRNSIYNIHIPLGVKYLTRLRIGFSHLKKHKFKNNFQDSRDPMCSSSSVIETAIHFFTIAQILILKDKLSLTK